MITKKTAEMTCKSTWKTPERQFPLIQKWKFSKFSPRCQSWWHLREILNQTTYPARSKLSWILQCKQHLYNNKHSEVKNIKHFSELKIILQEATTKNQFRVIKGYICNIASKKCTINCTSTLLRCVFLEISLNFNLKVLRIYKYQP